MKPEHSPAAVSRSEDLILDVLKKYITTGGRLLEIGSGTGEHAVYFAKHFPDLHWVTSEVKENHPDITSLLKKEQLSNLHGPELLKIGEDDFSDTRPFDYVFSANTLHEMSWKENKTLFKLLGKRLRVKARVFFYGPFNYQQAFSSPTQQMFDEWLKAQNPKSGIRNFEDVSQGMEKSGFFLLQDKALADDQHLLIFERQAFQ
jgi:cyclopropane fatty-acyl-phospholipid synthase-like methyltransferase